MLDGIGNEHMPTTVMTKCYLRSHSGDCHKAWRISECWWHWQVWDISECVDGGCHVRSGQVSWCLTSNPYGSLNDGSTNKIISLYYCTNILYVSDRNMFPENLIQACFQQVRIPCSTFISWAVLKCNAHRHHLFHMFHILAWTLQNAQVNLINKADHVVIFKSL